MKKESLFKKYLILFLTFLKIGLFTFGGGYAMIPIIQEEIVNKKKWLSDIELLDVIAISESTPGPISVDAAGYIGYRIAGVMGAICATLGLALPSFTIIFIISFFYDKFMQFTIIQNIFKGLRIGVIVLLITAVFKLKKNIKFSIFNWITFGICLISMLIITFFNLPIPSPSIIFIALGIISGLILEIVKWKGEKK